MEDIDGTPEHRLEVVFRKAARDGDIEKVQGLITKVAIDCKDQWGSTALMHSANMQHLDIVKCLIEAKAEIDSADKRGASKVLLCPPFLPYALP
jgi:ankyrin repeat protein